MPAAPPAADTKKPATPPPAKADDKSKGGDAKAAGGDKAGENKTAGSSTDQEKKGAAAGGDKTAAPAGGDKAAAGNAGQQRFDRMAVRAKLAVSEPGDAIEREADQIADKVMRMAEPPGESGKNKNPASAKPDQLKRKEQPKDKTSSQPPKAEAKPSAPEQVQRAESTAPQEPASLDETRPTPRSEPGGEILRQASDQSRSNEKPATPGNAPSTPSDLLKRLGAGSPLDPEYRTFFEQRMSCDLSNVRIHTDENAREAVRSLNARAFTWGHHIAFADGEYQTGSERTRQLLAHELAHVIQNDTSGLGNVIARKPPADPKNDPNNVDRGAMDEKKRDAADKDMQILRVPSIKSRHAATMYKTMAASKALARPKGLDRKKNPTNQKEIWLNEINITNEAAWFKKIGLDPAKSDNKISFYGSGGQSLTGSVSDIRQRLKIPYWSPDGTWRSMQVDHMVEVQVYKDADQIKNFELLSGAHNMNVGGLLKVEIYANVSKFLAAVDKTNNPTKVKEYLDNNEVPFRSIRSGGEGAHLEATSQFWSQSDIKAGKHLTWLIDEKRKKNEDGNTPGTFVLKSPTGSAFIAAFHIDGKGTVSGLPTDRVGGLHIDTITLNPKFEDATSGELGSLSGKWNFPEEVRTASAENISIPILKIEGLKYAGKLGEVPVQEADVQGASPLVFKKIEFLRGKVYSDGELAPTLAILEGNKIPVQWRGKDIRFYYLVPLEKLKDKFKVPGIVITDASLALFFGTEGLGAEGGIQFSITKMGEGQLTASISHKGAEPVFAMSGTFAVDASLFDEADITIAYSSADGFSGKGHLGITNPDKITGIKSASIEAGFTKDEFFANGGVEPKIPGLQSATISVTYNKPSSTLKIHGDVGLNSGIPGVESGNITVDVLNKDDVWKVAASGTLKPTFKGLGKDLLLSASYDDGKFNFKVENAEIKFGKDDMFKGTISAGLTNQDVDADGNISGEGGDDIRPYGKGTLTGKLTKWLTVEATATIDTNADVYLEGGLDVSSLEIFGRQTPLGEEEKKIFSIDTPKIPIVGITVGGVGLGITAHVGGSLSAVCYVGPGTLDNVSLYVLRFRPGSDDPIVLQGGGDLNIPAYAGLKLSATGNVDLDAGLVSLGGHIKADASLGAEADFSSTLNLTWSEETGVEILDRTTVTVAPKLAFDVTGGFHVDVNAVLTSFRVWSKDWELGHFEYGPDFKLSAMFDVSYNDKNGFSFGPSDPTEGSLPDLNDTGMYEGLLKDNPKEEQLVPADDAPEGTPTLGYGDVCDEEPEPVSSSVNDEEGYSDNYDSDTSVFPKNDGSPLDPERLDQSSLSMAAGDEDLTRRLGPGIPLDLPTRGYFEQRMGADFSDVRIHAGPAAAREARTFSAEAFTVGEHIAFAEGAFQPKTPEGQELIAHELAHVAQEKGAGEPIVLRWPAVTRGTAQSSETPATIKGKTLSEFMLLTQTQLDWATSSALQADATALGQFRNIQTFAEGPNITEACGDLKMGDIIAKTVPGVYPALRKYTEGVTSGSTAWLRRTNDTTKAERWGTELTKLETAWPAANLSLVMSAPDPLSRASPFERLENPAKPKLTEFINYLAACSPTLSADNGMEVTSFLELIDESVLPESYKGKIKHVTNYHHFTKDTLEGLVKNEGFPQMFQQWSVLQRPLTVVLYPSVDHNGAFHRNAGLQDMVKEPKMLTIVLEGFADIAGYRGQLAGVASRYGIDGEISQVMIAGHGNDTVLTLAGTATNTIKKDRLGTTGAEGTNTADLMRDLTALMSKDPKKRRIVLDACLTNSHDVATALRASPADAAADVNKAIAADPNLRDVVAKAAGAGADVRGASASFYPSETTFMTPGSTDIGLSVPGDPDVIGTKLQYVEFGTEPEGCMRAVLECWATDQLAGTHDCRDAMQRRITAGKSAHVAAALVETWSEAIIQPLYDLIVNNYWGNGEAIRQMTGLSGKLFGLRSKGHTEAGPLHASLLVFSSAAHVDKVLTSMAGDPQYAAKPRVALVLEQAWMQYTPGRRAQFLTALGRYSTCLEALNDLDMPLVMAHVPLLLLPLPPAASPPADQLKLALLATNHEPLMKPYPSPLPAHITFLRSLLGRGPTFPSTLDIDTVLGGLSLEKDVLFDIGRPVTGGGTTATGSPTPPSANIDTVHDRANLNDFRVAPLRKTGTVATTRDKLMVRSSPTTATKANIFATLATGTSVTIIGESGDWYAIEQPGRSGFVAKSYITVAP